MMLTLPRVAARLFGPPLAIEPARAEVIARVLVARVQGEQALPASWPPSSRPTLQVENGIASIPVHGTLVARGGFVAPESGLTSYQQLASDLRAALADASVRGIVLDVDSAGGEMTGLLPLVREIRAARAQKPVVAIARDQALSAAYAIASAAERLYASETAVLGSIGVLVMHLDQSEMERELGLRWTPIVGGRRKAELSSHVPLSDSARERLQALVDGAYAALVREVAANLGMDDAKVRATEAAILTAHEAVAGGFAARISDEVDIRYDARQMAGHRGRAVVETEEAVKTAEVVDLDGVRAEARREALAEHAAMVREITDLCTLAGAEHRAPEFLAQGLSVAEVRAALLAARSTAGSISPMHVPAGAQKRASIAAQWMDAYAPLAPIGGRPIGR